MNTKLETAAEILSQIDALTMHQASLDIEASANGTFVRTRRSLEISRPIRAVGLSVQMW